jgi:chitinase
VVSSLYPVSGSSVSQNVYSTTSYSASTEASATGLSTEYPAYPVSSSSKIPTVTKSTAEGYFNGPSVASKASYSQSGVHYSSTITTATVTYVDVCETGLTTITTTVVKTVCSECAKPTNTPEIPEGWTTFVTAYVTESKTSTITITKPIVYSLPTPEAYAVPSSVAPVASVAAYSGTPAPIESAPGYRVYPVSSATPEGSSAAPVASAPAYPAAPAPVKSGLAYSAYPASSATIKTSSAIPKPTGGAYVPVPEKPVAGKPVSEASELWETQTTTSILTQYITLTKTPVLVVTYTPAPYSQGPAADSTKVQPTGAPIGTSSGSSYPSYVPFEGAASRLSVGLSVVVILIAGFLAL